MRSSCDNELPPPALHSRCGTPDIPEERSMLERRRAGGDFESNIDGKLEKRARKSLRREKNHEKSETKEEHGLGL